jgi:hypothetical protein
MLGYGVHSKRSASQTKTEIQQLSQSKKPMIQSAGKDLEMKVVHENKGTKWFFLGGSLLIVLGGLATYRLRHKKKH